MTIELSRLHHRWKSLLDLAGLKLDQVGLPEPVFGVTVFSKQFVPAGAASFNLFEEDNASDEGRALLDKLASRLARRTNASAPAIHCAWTSPHARWR
jgi:hypothetical protein